MVGLFISCLKLIRVTLLIVKYDIEGNDLAQFLFDPHPGCLCGAPHGHERDPARRE